MHIFARITKVDEATHKVHGRAVQETVDRSGEIFDYATSKPEFEKWSTAAATATDGKSVGNLRAMHGKVAAGKLNEITFLDAEKAIDIVTEVVDENEWQKCLKGVYTGFSIGGSYAKKWPDEVNKGVQRYTAQPSEISLVDLPCVPTAQFTVIKADGAEELRKFETTTDDTEALAKWFESQPDGVREALAKITKRPDVDPKEGADKYGAGADFADAENKKYPLDTAKHIRAAWSYIHMPKNAKKYDAADLKTIKEKIVAAWKDKIDKAGPEAAEKVYAAQAERLAKHAEASDTANVITVLLGGEPMEKGLWAVSNFAGLLEQLAWMADGVDAEEQAEGDDSTLPMQFRNALKPLASAFLAMAAEETNEALHGQLNDDAALELAAGGDLAKAGKRHSAKDQAAIDALAKHHASAKKHLDAMSAHLDGLQGSNAPANDDDPDAAQKLAKAADVLQKMTAERDDLAAALEKITTQHAALLQKAAPPKGVAKAVPVSKDDDGDAQLGKLDDAPVLRKDGSVDHLATAEKAMRKVYAR